MHNLKIHSRTHPKQLCIQMLQKLYVAGCSPLQVPKSTLAYRHQNMVKLFPHAPIFLGDLILYGMQYMSIHLVANMISPVCLYSPTPILSTLHHKVVFCLLIKKKKKIFGHQGYVKVTACTKTVFVCT